MGIGDFSDMEPARLVDPELVEQCAELAAIFCAIDLLRMRAENFDARVVQRKREIVRNLAAHAHDDAVALFLLVEIEN